MAHGTSRPIVRVGLHDPRRTLPPERERRWRALPVVLMLGAIFVSSASWFLSPTTRAALWALAAVLSAVASYLFVRNRPVRHVDRFLVVDDHGLGITGTRSVRPLASLQEGFGVSLFLSATRDRAALAVTTPKTIVCIGAEAEGDDLEPLLPLAVTAPSEDLAMASVLPDGEPLCVDIASLTEVLDALIQIDARAKDRCFLSDAQGGSLVLDGHTLRTGICTIDLGKPFEWSATVFQERSEVIDTSYQATWIRQAQDQVALVSLLGEDTRLSIDDAMRSNVSSVDSFLLRDAHLSNAPPGPPPPSEVRIAVDRLFMLPLRRALDRAQERSH